METLKDFIIGNYDPDDVLELLGITTQELLDKFEERLQENAYKFKEEEEECERNE